MRLEWCPRALPLPACGAFAHGPSVPALARALAELPLLQQSRLQRIDQDDVGLLILGAAEDLPWSEGVRFLGAVEGSPQLLLPTLMQPNLPLDLLIRACARRAAGTRWLLLDEPALLWGLL